MEIQSYDIAISTLHVNVENPWWKSNLMYYLGLALGLNNLPPADSVDTEIMGWIGSGSGTYGNPTWGPGDLIGLRLVGANNGCFN